jgi:hypothetical protein
MTHEVVSKTLARSREQIAIERREVSQTIHTHTKSKSVQTQKITPPIEPTT